MQKLKHILLVEDDSRDIELTLASLKSNNIKTKTVIVRDGEKALDYLLYRGEFEGRTKLNPDLILLDLKMPKVDGMQVLRTIRTNDSTKLIPTVIFTSSDDKEDINICYNLRANAYVVKPVKFSEFSEIVGNIASFWENTNTPPPKTFDT